MRFFTAISCLLLSVLVTEAQINPEAVDIVRDQWGVPHIFAKTDVEVAYGFAWATAEDDFKTMQDLLLPVKGLAGLVNGKKGAVMDVAVHLIGAEEIVEARYEKDLSPGFRKYVEAYCAGVNAYAENHPKEILHRKLFPISGKDVIKAYVVGMSLMSGVERALTAVLKGEIASPPIVAAVGSNALAVSSRKTKDGKTYLAINSHQPLEGVNSWYETHLHSEEGLNFLGGTFAGAPVVHIGVNPYLGWGHTVNYPDLTDVFRLEMHPKEKLLYKFDNEWLKLAPYHTKARIKALGILKIGVKQKFYQSKYGVTIETDQGFYALRFPGNRNIKAAEQWYRMTKAMNLDEFMTALKMQGHISLNTVYADREDNIFHISNGLFPKRNGSYDWKEVLPGNTSATLWPDDYYPIDSLPQVLNPAAGFVFNCNNTPFISTAPADNPDPKTVPTTMGFQAPDAINNRSVRLLELIGQYDQISYDDFKRIKYDRSYNKPLHSATKLEPIFHLNPETYPDLAENIRLLADWDREANIESEAAATFILVINFLRRELKDRASFQTGDELNEKKLIEALRHAQNHLLKYFGKKRMSLGELQRHSRGEIDLPVSGGTDVLAALSARKQKDGRLRARAGDSYIEMARFSKNGVEIETINAFGASAKPDSPHYTDQMEMYVNQKLKPMTLDKETIFREAKRVYHPR